MLNKPRWERTHHIMLEETHNITFYFFIGRRDFNPYIDIGFLLFCGVDILKEQFKLIPGCEYVTSKLTSMKKDGKWRDRSSQYIVPLDSVFEIFPLVKNRFTDPKDELKIRSLILKLNSTENALARFVEPFFTGEIFPKLLHTLVSDQIPRVSSEKDRPRFSELVPHIKPKRSDICSYDVFEKNRLCFVAFSINIYKTKYIYVGFTWNLKKTLTKFFFGKKTLSNEFLLNDFKDIFSVIMHTNTNQHEECFNDNKDVNRFSEFIDKKIMGTGMTDEDWSYDQDDITKELLIKTNKTAFTKILAEIRDEQAPFFEDGFTFLTRNQLSNVVFQAYFEIKSRDSEQKTL